MNVYGILHDTAALLILSCLALPFVALRWSKAEPGKLAEQGRKWAAWLRILNFVLIVSLVTGLVRSGLYFSGWLVGVLVLFLVIAALLGVLLKRTREIVEAARSGQPHEGSVRAFFNLSVLLALAVVAMVLYKVVPW